MDIAERLARERRARLAAERLLEHKQRELFAANEKLALHARALSEQIVEQRSVVRNALSEAEALKGQNSRFLGDLERAHTAAVMAERRLWDSIETIRDGFAVFDSAQRLVAANRAYLSAFEGVQIAPGLPYADLLRHLAGSGRVALDDGADAWCDAMLARWETDSPDPVVLRLTCGSWLQLEDRRARDGDMVCLAVDITEQMRLRAAIEAVPDGFVLFDRNDRLLLCNSRYREIYPCAAPAMQPGASFESILRYGLAHGQSPEVTDPEAWLAERLARYRHPGEAAEYEMANGRWLRVLDQATPDGGRVGLRMDITELKEQQAALDAARLAAEAANRAKSAFLANMSHEIRTPMNGVVGMAELLCDTTLTGDQRLFAETIRSSGEALLVIINDILDYSKIEAGRLTLHPEPFDLERTIHEVAMLLQPRARAQGIDLIVHFDMALPTRYIGDPGRLRQVLTNLVGNAVKFTAKGHVTIRVLGGEAGPGLEELHVTVEDTGIGIAPEHLAHIFGEFNQLETGSNRKFEGTGLGLAISRRLVEMMQGEIWVDSTAGRGSCFGFRLTLPVADDAAAPPVAGALTRALVVDDRFLERTILERQLTACGIRATLCRSGPDALAELARDGPFDLVLTDHEMPGMDGCDLAEALRAGGWTMPLLLLSSDPAAPRVAETRGLFAAVLQKPLLRSDLYRQLQRLSAPPEPEPAPPPEPGARRMRVLAAEDNRTNQLVFAKMLRDLPIEITFAANGAEAVALYRSLAPDLIFMDISMPEMDGREAARAIRRLEAGRARVPIVALTAHAMEGDAEGILAAGIDRYLTKPLRKSAILEALTLYRPEDACDLAPLRPDDAA